MQSGNGNSAKGFTLIELTTVIVIIGLLIGAMITARSLIRQSHINSAEVDAQKYIAATVNFQQRFGYLPGDMPTATHYWGTATGCPSVTSGTGGTATCNGDGNGQIAENATYNYEMFTYWQQLSAAGMIDGSYTGYAGTAGSSDNVIGKNIPAGKLDYSGFGIMYAGIRNSDANFFNNTYGHVYVFGGYSANKLPVGAVLSGSEALNLDAKFDDGMPSVGQIMTWQTTTGYTPNCTNLNASNVTVYKSGEKTAQCSMIFVTGF